MVKDVLQKRGRSWRAQCDQTAGEWSDGAHSSAQFVPPNEIKAVILERHCSRAIQEPKTRGSELA